MQSNCVFENLIPTPYTNTLDHGSDGTYPWHLRMFLISSLAGCLGWHKWSDAPWSMTKCTT
jgi:hypothetical protein